MLRDLFLDLEYTSEYGLEKWFFGGLNRGVWEQIGRVQLKMSICRSICKLTCVMLSVPTDPHIGWRSVLILITRFHALKCFPGPA